MGVVVKRFDVVLVNLDTAIGIEIKETRPCLVVSPDEMNRHIRTVIVAPMTIKGREYVTRVPIRFHGKSGMIVLDQLRTIDKSRLVQRLGKAHRQTAKKVLSVLADMFAP